MNAPGYAELHCLSDFSFGRGASSARELFERAKCCGYAALAITDECSLAGIVRAHEAARDTGVKLIVGSEIQLADGPKLVLLAQDHAGYTNLCRLITQGRRAADKGAYRLTRADLADGLPGTLALWIPVEAPGRLPTHAHREIGHIPPALCADPLPAEGGEGCVRRAPTPPTGGAAAPAHPTAVSAPRAAGATASLPLSSNPPPSERRGTEGDGAWPLRTADHIPPTLRVNPLPAEGGIPRRDAALLPPSERRGTEGDGVWPLRTADRIPPALRADPLPAEGGEDCARYSPTARTPDREHGAWLKSVFGDRLWLAVELVHEGDDAGKLQRLMALAEELGIPAVAAGDVHMHVRSRRALQDTLTAIRYRRTLIEARGHLFRNGERHLRRRGALAAIYPESLLAETVRIAARCTFSLTELQYRYPAELVPEGHTPTTWLRHLTKEGARWRWPDGVPLAVHAQLEHELALIAELKYEPYFLTVHDIVRFARAQGILCQGRGSAANSAVCFALGITEVDPARINTLVERFISKERNEPPDIDVDFEHQRREEVLQYVYRKYGRERAAITAEVICYKAKSAVRDVAKALGLPPDAVDKLAFAVGWWDGETPIDARLVEAGFDPASPILRRMLKLTATLIGRPRHLSQHVGGFVISDAPLATLVPAENAAMPERTIIQWDKDDLDSLGLLKVDCLALGMLTCVRKCLDLLRAHHRGDLTLATIPAEDPATYAMIDRADTVGVFQIESRAQMAMLPRLKPKRFYDLVIEIAIVRPGPIQGDMIHPYLKRRNGIEPVTYPSEDVRAVLERTLGVPLFQEQVMKLAVVAAGYTPGEADQLRRSMAAWHRHGDIEQHRDRVTRGMLARGYTPEFSEALFDQLKGFGSYGFPESHAASFALIAYASAWLKCHEPAAFLCALLNSLPMGFYIESQLVQDARRHGIQVNPVDVRYSDWDCTLEAPVSRANGTRSVASRPMTTSAWIPGSPAGKAGGSPGMTGMRGLGAAGRAPRVADDAVDPLCLRESPSMVPPDPSVVRTDESRDPTSDSVTTSTWISGSPAGKAGGSPGMTRTRGLDAAGRASWVADDAVDPLCLRESPSVVAPGSSTTCAFGIHGSTLGSGVTGSGATSTRIPGSPAGKAGGSPGMARMEDPAAVGRTPQVKPPQPALRLGLRLARGFREEVADRIGAARRVRAFTDLADLVERAGLDARDRKLLADAGALRGLAGHRHRARWAAAGIEPQRPLFGFASPEEARIALAPPSTGEDTLADYAATGLTLGAHPMRQLRAQLRARRCRPSRELRALRSGAIARAAGLVTLRQRPLTADGVTFVSLEDEDGMVNVVIWPQLAEQQRRVLLQARLLGVEGRWESASGVQNLIARRLFDYSALLGTLDIRSRDFR